MTGWRLVQSSWVNNTANAPRIFLPGMYRPAVESAIHPDCMKGVRTACLKRDKEGSRAASQSFGCAT